MAVTIASYDERFISDGVTRALPLPFSVLEAEHLIVSTIQGTTETFLPLGSGYSVAGDGDGEAACTVTLAAAAPFGATIYIRRVVPIKQLIDFRTQGPFSPEMWEYAADLLTMICQQAAGATVDIREIIGGEINYGANANLAGVGVYDGKIGAALQFRGIRPGSGKISINYNAPTRTIDVDLGSVGPGDVGAAPASLSGAVSTNSTNIDNHDNRIQALEERRVVTLRGEYEWNGVGYDLVDSYDPHGRLPGSLTLAGVGDLPIFFQSAMPTAHYRVAVTTGMTASTPSLPAYACWSLKKETELSLRFYSAEGPRNVEAFSLFIDLGNAE